MTTLSLGAYGAVTVELEQRECTTRVTSSGQLTLPAGTWRVVQVAAGPDGSVSRRQDETAGTVTVDDIDVVMFHGDTTQPATVAVYVQVLQGADYVTVAYDTSTETLPARPAAGVKPIGVNVFAIVPVDPYTTTRDPAAELDALPALDFVRVAVPWRSLQPASAAWDATMAGHYDTVFADIASHDLAVQLTVGTVPPWARAGGTTSLHPPSNPATFATWVDSIIDRWSSTVDIISIGTWNEPNHSSGDTWLGTDTQMVELIDAAHDGASGRVPTAAGALAFADYDYLQQLFDAGLTTTMFDGVALNIYPIEFTAADQWRNPALPINDNPADRIVSPLAGIHMIQNTLEANGATNKSLWVTETGVGSNPIDTDPWLALTERQGAAWLATIIDQLRRVAAVESIAVHESFDRAEAASWMNGFGVLRADLSRRPTWAVLNTL